MNKIKKINQILIITLLVLQSFSTHLIFVNAQSIDEEIVADKEVSLSPEDHSTLEAEDSTFIEDKTENMVDSDLETETEYEIENNDSEALEEYTHENSYEHENSQDIQRFNLDDNLLINPNMEFVMNSDARISGWEMIAISNSGPNVTRNLRVVAYTGGNPRWGELNEPSFSISNQVSSFQNMLTLRRSSGQMRFQMSQSVETIRGKKYKLSILARDGNVAGGSVTIHAVKGNDILSDSESIFSQRFQTTNSLDEYSFEFVAESDTTSIGFEFHNSATQITTQTTMTGANLIPLDNVLMLEASPEAGGTPTANEYSLLEGATTSITANPNEGFRFINWELISGDGIIENPDIEETKFLMGKTDTIIRANYEEIANVSTWEQYRAAINNQRISAINVLSDLSGNTTLNSINRDLIIHGNGHKIDSQSQRYQLIGKNQKLTITNAHMTNNSSLALFGSGSVAENINLELSDFKYDGVGGLTNIHVDNLTAIESITFGGEFNEISTSASVTIADVNNMTIKSGSILHHTGGTLMRRSSATSTDIIESTTLTIEKDGELNSESTPNSNSAVLEVGILNIYGSLNINSNGFVLGDRGRKSNLSMTIDPSSRFDISNINGGPLISYENGDANVNISAKNLALWDLGLQNENMASMVFEDVNVRLDSKNAAGIESSNNERFNSLYDSNGLAGYSRLSNGDVDEMNREVIVLYLNEFGDEIAEKEIIEGKLGQVYQTNIKEIPGYTNIEVPSNKNGIFLRDVVTVSYIYRSNIVSPVDPLNPDNNVELENSPVIPENQGWFSIDFASQLNFGIQGISVKNKVYYAEPQRLINEEKGRPNFIQISDRRSEEELTDWTLSATLGSDGFKDESDDKLTGAQISFENQEIVAPSSNTNTNQPRVIQNNPVLIPGAKINLITANSSEAKGTWVYRFGDQETANSSVKLEVPKGVNPNASTYKATIEWELSNVPDNK